jgi:hypothetical protein
MIISGRTATLNAFGAGEPPEAPEVAAGTRSRSVAATPARRPAAAPP